MVVNGLTLSHLATARVATVTLVTTNVSGVDLSTIPSPSISSIGIVEELAKTEVMLFGDSSTVSYPAKKTGCTVENATRSMISNPNAMESAAAATVIILRLTESGPSVTILYGNVTTEYVCPRTTPQEAASLAVATV